MASNRDRALGQLSLLFSGGGLLLVGIGGLIHDGNDPSDLTFRWVSIALGTIAWLIALVSFYRSRRAPR